ncbi:MAG: cell surface protein [Ferruginibacter sp.]|nr:cell surface protein [Ferruginibacter sp.]
MKKLLLLLMAVFTLGGMTATAQTSLTCNAEFSVQYQTSNNIKFTPVVIGDSFNTYHYWRFGDGNLATGPLPTHLYVNPGTYTAWHFIVRHNSAGTVSCSDSFSRVIVIQSTTPTCNLQAGFYFYRDSSATSPLTYHFQNISAPLNSTDSIRWTFGDGTSSNQLHPNHTYSQAGSYNVCLRIIRRNPNGGLTDCVRETCQQVVVTNPCNLTAYFSFYRDTTSNIPNTYHFQNQSPGLSSSDSIRWTFGDGSSSNQVSPNHTYAVAGTYNVCIRIIKRTASGGLSNCVSEFCKTVVVTTPCNLVAYFSFYRDSLNTVPNTYHFQNQSAGFAPNDSIRWTFGDGTSSNQINPNHTYLQPGTYNVCLRVMKRNTAGTVSNCVSEICKTVIVTQACTIHAAFTSHADSLNSRKIIFTNTSLSPAASATASWNFGDGSSASSWNAVHEYAQPGRYLVCLTVRLSNSCISITCDSITIAVPTPDCQAQSAFSFAPATTEPRTFHFTPLHINSTWQYTWTFGDGTGSHDISPNHHYANPGNYTVCLTVYRNGSCASTTCRTVYAPTVPTCTAAQLSFALYRDSIIHNKFKFQALSTGTLIDQVWTITKLNGQSPVILHQNNPLYTFPDSGYYRVCLRATFLGGCVREACQVIYIAPMPATGCTLQLYPNPASSVINASVYLGQPQMIHVYVYTQLNVQVRELHQQGVTGNNYVSVNIAGLPAGTYTLKLVHGNDVCYKLFQKL